jgi:hypothetical protein
MKCFPSPFGLLLTAQSVHSFICVFIAVEGDPPLRIQYCNCLSTSISDRSSGCGSWSSEGTPLPSFHGPNSVGRRDDVIGARSTSPRTPPLLSSILPNLYSLSLSRAVLKSSKMMVSVKHLKTKASFQKGLRPSGNASFKTLVTDRQSRMMKPIDKIMLNSRIPNRGETLMSSTKPKSYRRLMFQKRLIVVKIHQGSLDC